MKIRWYSLIILLQVIGLVVTLFLSIPLGDFHHFVHELILSLTFTNLIGIAGTVLYGIYKGLHNRFGSKLFWVVFLAVMGMLALAVIIRFSLWIGMFICGLDDFVVNRWHLFIIVVDFIISAVFIVFAILLGLYEKLSTRLEKKIIENESLKRLQIESKLTLLQSKINPHFLFNTLNTMVDIVRKDPDTVEKIILNLSDIYRKTLTMPDQSQVPLHEELLLVRQYLDIEKVRMGDRLNYSIDVSDNIKEMQVPPMILQMLVENAVKHGISPNQEGGTVTIAVAENDNDIQLTVTDDGVGFKQNTDHKGFGLFSIQQRLNLLYENAVMEIKQMTKGTQVRIVLPHAY